MLHCPSAVHRLLWEHQDILGYKDKGGLKHSLLQNPTYVGEISADLSDRVQSGRRQARKGSSVLPLVGSRKPCASEISWNFSETLFQLDWFDWGALLAGSICLCSSLDKDA